MASSGNFPTMNPFIQSGGSGDDKSSGYISNGALKVNVIKGRCGPVATIGMRTSGKYYFEVYVNYFFGGTNVAIVNESWNLDAMPGYQIDAQNTTDYDLCGYYFGNGKLNNAQSAGDGNNFTTYGDALVQGSVLGVAVDVDNGKVWFHKDGTYPNSGNPATGANPARGSGGTITTAMDFTTKTWFVTAGGWGQTTGIITYNFGQDSTFGGEISAGGNQDSNSQGDFKYSVPSGFTCLSSNNIPISADIDPAQTDDDYPSKLMTTANWSGTAGSKTITGVGFKPDLTIIKSADQGNSDWCLFDTSRGVEKILEPNTSTVEESNSNSLTAFSTDGFTVGSDSRVNGNSYLMTAQCWKANGGTTSANSDGAISSVTQANTKSGFSITTFTGLASSNFSSTVGHGLTKAPEFIIHKALDTAGSWWSQHVACTSTSKVVALDSTGAEVNLSSYGALSAPTSSVFSVNGVEGIGGGGSARSYISYSWHSVEGYSSFGSYVGNGNADGPYVSTSHMPRCVWIKRIDSSAEWAIYFWNETTTNASYVRLKQNPLDSRLTFDAGSMNNGELIDFLSNGFKIRDSDAILNSDGGTYLYCSWGSVPFKYNNAF